VEDDRRREPEGAAGLFRSPARLAALERSVVPALVDGRSPPAAIRIWVPGCGAGEDLYAILAVLAEALAARGLEIPITAFGTDVDARRIESARRGVYPPAVLEDLSPSRRRRFFVPTEAGHRIRQDLRDRCIFAVHDPARDPAFSRLDLLYAQALSPAVQRLARPTLLRAVLPGGFAVLSRDEGVGPPDGFDAVDAEHGVFVRRTLLPARLQPSSDPPLRHPIAELHAAHREAIASVDELLSLNEELTAAREELATANDELRATNDDLSRRSAEATRLHDDLTNVLASAGIPILFLGPDGTVRRYTPPAATMFALIAKDVGRPFAHLASRLRVRTQDLAATAAAVLARLRPIEELVQDVDGRWHQVTVRPYLTADGKIDGTVIAIVDVDPVKRSEQEAEARVAAYQDKLRAMAFDAARAEERERRRIAADLHDRIGHSLALAQIRLGALRDTLPAEARPALLDCLHLIEESIADTRTLTFDLSPPILYDLGLSAALSWLGEQLAERHGVEIVVEGDDDAGLDPELASILFRVVRELLANVVKHARSPRARVSLDRDEGHLAVDVEDEGVGFDDGPLAREGRGGFGLFSVREQIERIGGTMAIASEPGAGARIRLRVPLAARAAPDADGRKPGR
jgi:signal transduction histidine kinase/chemotaxis methyl-accepting protein methylase